MTLKTLYDKVPPDKQNLINVIDNRVFFDDGINIYTYYLNGDVLIPINIESRNFLNSLL